MLLRDLIIQKSGKLALIEGAVDSPANYSINHAANHKIDIMEKIDNINKSDNNSILTCLETISQRLNNIEANINRHKPSPKIKFSNSSPEYNNPFMETIIENDRESGSSNHNNKSHNNYNKNSHIHASSPRSGMSHSLDPLILNKFYHQLKIGKNSLEKGNMIILILLNKLSIF